MSGAPDRLVIKLTGGRYSGNDYVYETSELIPMDGGTRLEQTIEIHDSGIPLLFRIVIWFIRCFGNLTGKSYRAGVKASQKFQPHDSLPSRCHQNRDLSPFVFTASTAY